MPGDRSRIQRPAGGKIERGSVLREEEDRARTREARTDLEQMLGSRVFLDLRVKVRKNWRRDLNQIRRFGYGEGT